MNKYLEKFLLSILLCASVLLGMSFWLSVRFGFNMFLSQHWDELAKLQIAHMPVNKLFYVSLGIGLFIIIFGLYIIFKPKSRNIVIQKTLLPAKSVTETKISQSNQNALKQSSPQTFTNLTQPPRLNLPKDITNIVAQHHTEQILAQNTQQKPPRITIYDSELSDIFTNANYLMKPNLTTQGFTSNLFAIGTGEVIWIGAVDCDIGLLKNVINKLKNIFTETLEDIPITISAFILDTKHLYTSDKDVLVFHTINELKEFINNNPNKHLDESEQENFDAYSDYIDTIITYAKNI